MPPLLTDKLKVTKVAASKMLLNVTQFSFYRVSGACLSVDIDIGVGVGVGRNVDIVVVVDDRKKCRFEKSDNFLFCCYLRIPLNSGVGVGGGLESKHETIKRYFRYFLKPRLTTASTTLTYLFSIILCREKIEATEVELISKFCHEMEQDSSEADPLKN